MGSGRWWVRTALIGVLFAGGAAGAAPQAAWVRAATPPAETPADLRDLSVQEIRGRLKLLDDEHSAALAQEDYDKAARILREINRLDDELVRRNFGAPLPRPPDRPAPRP